MNSNNKIFTDFLNKYTLIDNKIFYYIDELSEEEIKVYLSLQRIISNRDDDLIESHSIPFNISMFLKNMTENEIITVLKKLENKKLVAYIPETDEVKILIPDVSLKTSQISTNYRNLETKLIEITKHMFTDKSLYEIIKTANDYSISEDGIVLIIKYMKDLGFGAEKSYKRIISNINKFGKAGFFTTDELKKEIERRKAFTINGVLEIKKELQLNTFTSQKELDYVQEWEKYGFKLINIQKILNCKYYFINSFQKLDAAITEICNEYSLSHDDIYVSLEFLEKDINQKNLACELVSKILYRLNIAIGNKKQYIDKVLSYLKLGFEEKTILLIVNRIYENNLKTFNAFENKMDFLIKNNIISYNDVKKQIDKEKDFDKNLINIFRIAGSNKEVPSEKDRIYYSKWINEYHLDNQFIINVIKAIYMDYLNMSKLNEIILKVKNKSLYDVNDIRKFLNVKEIIEKKEEKEEKEDFQPFKIKGRIIE